MKNRTIFSKKQVIELHKLAHNHLYTAVEMDFKRATSIRVNDLVADIYEETFSPHIDRSWNCATCVFNAYKRIGLEYKYAIDKYKLDFTWALEE